MHAVCGSGLLMWHCFCDNKDISDPQRALATQPLVSAFIAHMATAYSRRTISNYLNGVQVWHILHSIPWAQEEMDAILCTTKKLTPVAMRRKRQLPYTPAFITSVRQHLDLDDPLNAVIFTCLTTCFYALARLGKFTIQTISSFNLNKQITTQCLSYNQDWNGLQVMVLHLPTIKVTGNEGKDVYWATQNVATNPTAALQNHLRINQLSEATHLLMYHTKNTPCCPLTKPKAGGPATPFNYTCENTLSS